jgi:hypothetical protein
VGEYINDEINYGALKRADTTKFNFIHKSPLMSRPKYGDKRRVILDLSWPKNPGASVNASVPENRYLNTEFALKLPTVDSICDIINTFNEPIMLYKIDLAWAFRQIPIDPLDVAYLGISWGEEYIDTALPFGFRHGRTICQRITDAVRFILSKCNIQVINYIDDFIAIVPAGRAFEMFEITKSILSDIALVTSDSKTVKPAYQCNCLGIVVDPLDFTLSIPQDKLRATISICKQLQKFKKLTKHQLQSILGLLMYLHKAIKPARLFVNRIIALLRIAPHNSLVHVAHVFRRDLEWFCRFAQVYNGITQFDKSIIFIDNEVYMDASLNGIGARFCNKVYAYSIEGKGDNIAYWEALNVLVALRTWADKFMHKTVRV